MSVEQAVSLNASIYNKTWKQMVKLGPGQLQLQKYQPLLWEQLKVSTAVSDPNARGQQNESLAWFWSLDIDLSGPSESWNDELVEWEMDWTYNFFLQKAAQWDEHMRESLENQLRGHACYVARQSRMVSLLAQDAQAAFQDLTKMTIDTADE
ncbi:uncharacterized protein EDB91DRAFT_1255021 [Suillus paluster]|uniref:uncharacterized protein n=1 Tax=Suillus paluster TaxID=48578 RepID=UPI001B86A99E|nr:uncharacterized protein EDB91DRAFT_1255021 [Suillus paluster]KAG1724883.1 hypothetical protein EDB91DRAFT_1255021 [Suillus paluster]